MKIIITGTPCTGKTTLAKKLSSMLGCSLIELNKEIIQQRIWRGKEHGAKIVDLLKLKKFLIGKLNNLNSFVCEGHLACEVSLPCDIVIVLRSSPSVLLKRMNERSYSFKKISENLLSEILDYCLIKAEENYEKNKIIQVDNSRPVSAKKILSKIKNSESDFVDYTGFLLKPRFAHFFFQKKRHFSKNR